MGTMSISLSELKLMCKLWRWLAEPDKLNETSSFIWPYLLLLCYNWKRNFDLIPGFVFDIFLRIGDWKLNFNSNSTCNWTRILECYTVKWDLLLWSFSNWRSPSLELDNARNTLPLPQTLRRILQIAIQKKYDTILGGNVTKQIVFAYHFQSIQ